MQRIEYWVCADTFELPYKSNVTVSDIAAAWPQDCRHDVYTDLSDAVKAYTRIPVSTCLQTGFSGRKFLSANVAALEAVTTEYDEDTETWEYIASAENAVNLSDIAGSGFRAEAFNV